MYEPTLECWRAQTGEERNIRLVCFPKDLIIYYVPQEVKRVHLIVDEEESIAVLIHVEADCRHRPYHAKEEDIVSESVGVVDCGAGVTMDKWNVVIQFGQSRLGVLKKKPMLMPMHSSTRIRAQVRPNQKQTNSNG